MPTAMGQYTIVALSDGAPGAPGAPGSPGGKGDPGATATAYIEYTLVADGGVPDAGSVWSEAMPAWTVGMVFWRRTRSDYSDGSTSTYSDPTPDNQLTELLKQYVEFSFSLSSTTYVRDLRNPSGSTSILMHPRITGYGAILPVFSVDGVDITESSLQIPYTEARDSITIGMHAEHEGAVLTAENVVLSVIDETIPSHYLGAFDTSPQNADGHPLMAGDWHFLRSEGLTKVWTGTTWKTIDSSDANFSEMALSTLPDKFASSTPVDESVVENQYVHNLIANTVTAGYVGAKDIELQENGTVHSKGYSKGTVAKLIAGETLPAGSPSRGFHMDSSGEAEFYRADMYEVNVSKGILNDVTVNGELGADTFATLKTQQISSAHRAIDITGGTAYWDENDALSAISTYGNETFHALSGSYGGKEYASAIRLTEAQRTQQRSLGSYSDLTQQKMFSVTSPGFRTSIRFTGTPIKFSLDTLNGTVTLQSTPMYKVGSGSFIASNDATVEVAPNTSVTSLNSAPSSMVSDDAVLFKTKTLTLWAARTDGQIFHADSSATYDRKILVCDGSYVLRFNEDLTQCSKSDLSLSFMSNYSGCAYGNGRLVIMDTSYIGSSPPHTFVSTNGGESFSSYNPTSASSKGTYWSKIWFFNGYFYAYYSGLGGYSGVMKSTDGINWSTASGLPPNTMDPSYVQVGGYMYCLEMVYDFDAGTITCLLKRSSDLASWSTVSTVLTMPCQEVHDSTSEGREDKGNLSEGPQSADNQQGTGAGSDERDSCKGQ